MKGNKLKYAKYEDSHNRTIIFSSVESDYDHSYRRCSYVSMANRSETMVGRILVLFQHIFLDKSATFAYVSWFQDIYKDAESGLTYVLDTVQTQSVVPIEVLSRPLVVASDDEETEKLWILNLKV